MGKQRSIFTGLAIAMIYLSSINPIYGKTTSLFSMTGEASTSYEYDSNIYRTGSNEVDDSVMQVSPTFALSTNSKIIRIRTNYNGVFRRYVANGDEDHQMNMISLSAQTDNEAAIYGHASMNYRTSEDIRGGSSKTVQANDVPDSFDTTGGQFGFTVQNLQRKIGFESLINFTKTRYIESQLGHRNTDTQGTRFTGRYTISGRSNVYLFVDRKKVLFTESSSGTNDNLEMKYGAGGVWLVSGKLRGNAELAYNTKNAIEPNTQVASYSGLYTKMSLSWSRKKFSKYTISISRKSTENVDVGVLNNVQTGMSFIWDHEFSKRMKLFVKFDNSINQAAGDNESFFYEFSPIFTYFFSPRLNTSIAIVSKQKTGDDDTLSNNVFNPKVSYKFLRDFLVSTEFKFDHSTATREESVTTWSSIFTFSYKLR